jgi:hypothetical protein
VFGDTSPFLYNILVSKGSNPALMMLFRKTKNELQAALYMSCLSLHMNTTELEEYENATYEETMQVIVDNGWNELEEYENATYEETTQVINDNGLNEKSNANVCNKYLINDWYLGEPNGGGAHQCIVNGPMTSFKYADIDCNNLDQDMVGFLCMHYPPYVSD